MLNQLTALSRLLNMVEAKLARHIKVNTKNFVNSHFKAYKNFAWLDYLPIRPINGYIPVNEYGKKMTRYIKANI